MDDSPVESRKGESKKNWIWVILGLLVLIVIVIWAVNRGIDTDASVDDPELGWAQPAAESPLAPYPSEIAPRAA